MSTGALHGRRALVTGGTRGIGAAIARTLAGAGATVAVVARSRDAVDAAAAGLGAGHAGIAADLATAGGVDAVVAAAEAWAGGAPDIVVNNASAFAHARVHEQDMAELDALLRLGVEAPFRLVRAFLPAMRARGSGDIVTIGSIADQQAFPGNAAYSAAKFGVRAVHEVLRAETRGTGVRAMLVSPAATDTGIWAPVEGQLGRTFPARDAMLAADDVARAVAFVLAQPPHVDVDELRLSRS